MKKMQKIAPLVQSCRRSTATTGEAGHGDAEAPDEHGFNPLADVCRCWCGCRCSSGCSTANGFGPGATSNYVFGAEEVASFVEADLFGAKLSISLTQTLEVLAAFGRPHSCCWSRC